MSLQSKIRKGVIESFETALRLDVAKAESQLDEAVEAPISSDDVSISAIDAKQRNIRQRTEELTAARAALESI